MKGLKIFLLGLTLSLLAATVAAPAADACSRSRRMARLVKSYRNTPGMKVTPVGSVGMKTIRFLGALAGGGDAEFKNALSSVRGIEKLYFVNYSECSQSVKNTFTRRVDRILGTQDKIMEFKGSGDPMTFYGMTSKSGDKVSDLVINCPAQGIMVCFLGSISSSDVQRLAKAFGY